MDGRVCRTGAEAARSWQTSDEARPAHPGPEAASQISISRDPNMQDDAGSVYISDLRSLVKVTHHSAGITDDWLTPQYW